MITSKKDLLLYINEDKKQNLVLIILDGKLIWENIYMEQIE